MYWIKIWVILFATKKITFNSVTMARK